MGGGDKGRIHLSETSREADDDDCQPRAAAAPVPAPRGSRSGRCGGDCSTCRCVSVGAGAANDAEAGTEKFEPEGLPVANKAESDGYAPFVPPSEGAVAAWLEEALAEVSTGGSRGINLLSLSAEEAEDDGGEDEAKAVAGGGGVATQAVKTPAPPSPIKKVKRSRKTFGDRGVDEPYPLWLVFFPFASGKWVKGAGGTMESGWFNRALRQSARQRSAYPEWGNAGALKWIEGTGSAKEQKLAARELMHGRWAMLGVTGAIAAENTTGVPWFEAGGSCTFDISTPCTLSYGGYDFEAAPYAVWGLTAIEIALMAGVEVHRTGWPAFQETPPSAFADCEQNDMYPGGRFDPLNVGTPPGSEANTEYLQLMQVREIKHGRLAMLAWLGMIVQAVATKQGPMANLATHRADPSGETIVSNWIEPLFAASNANLAERAAEIADKGIPTYADNAAAVLDVIS